MTGPEIPFGWRAEQPLVLASGSATRRQMLLAAGLPVDVVLPEIDERAVEREAREAGAGAALRARLLARAKAEAVAAGRPERIVLAADQTLEGGGHPGTKANDVAEARRFLALLAGRAHVLHSAAAVAVAGRVVLEVQREARLIVRPLSSKYIADYVEALGPAALASVGGYQIEGPGLQLFERIGGDHSTILGLPLLAVLAGFRRLGLMA